MKTHTDTCIERSFSWRHELNMIHCMLRGNKEATGESSHIEVTMSDKFVRIVIGRIASGTWH